MAGLTSVSLPHLTGADWPGVRYFCTRRQGGVSHGSLSSLNLALHVKDDPEHVAINRARLAMHLPSEPIWLNQVHGTDVFDADLLDAPIAAPPTADALVTTQVGRVLAVMSADCLPVVVAGENAGALGVAHAGWRGLAAGVLENTIDSLAGKQAMGGLRAWIGPGIGQSHFEVGDEVRAAFADHDAHAAVYFKPTQVKGKWMADLAGIARHRLLRAGVSHVESCGQCTFENSDDFYSHRRDPASGRMATVAWLTAV